MSAEGLLGQRTFLENSRDRELSVGESSVRKTKRKHWKDGLGPEENLLQEMVTLQDLRKEH